METSNIFSLKVIFEHSSGDILYPIRIKNLDTGKVAFRLSKNSNLKSEAIEVECETEMARLVINGGYSVRAANLNKKRTGIYSPGGSSILKVLSEL